MLLFSALKSFSNKSVSDVFLVLYTQRQKIILSFVTKETDFISSQSKEDKKYMYIPIWRI